MKGTGGDKRTTAGLLVQTHDHTVVSVGMSLFVLDGVRDIMASDW